MIALPANLADLESLVRNQVPESIHLDYKASPALDPKKRDEIVKDVSAFANSDGGLLIYGVEEDKISHLPLQIDAGVAPKWNREWLEQLITSNVNPRIDGIEIRQFALSNGNFVVCVQVQQSFRGPHQASDNKYYKRFNFSRRSLRSFEHPPVKKARADLELFGHLRHWLSQAHKFDGLGFEFRCISFSGHWFHCRLFLCFVVQKSRAPHDR